MGYRINLSAKPPTCEKFTLTQSFRKIGVPDADTLSYKAIIGTDAVFGAGVEVNGYTGEFNGGDGGIQNLTMVMHMILM